ncbi:very short patch repair endonuclease [Streptomyces sp. F001]|uniref:very short patch repair endonuclease n=1 Tax=Streptomyces sp. F001 TaxID=1510026 RepID=UPI00101E4560|nr:very short patch repair endonuclease [Streptomyces sp. F001]RZB17129.1 very short patch repair endonuclease [Streptomyces sp. F001]
MTTPASQPDQPQAAWTPPEGSWASSAARRRNMQAIRSRDTTPERLIRRLVHAQGLRYRVAARPLSDLRRTADMIFRPAKVAVFIDGCYWHGCPEHYVPPKTNPGYWSDKVARNIARDRDTDERLQAAGWLVLRFWEHQSAEECSDAICRAVTSRRPAAPGSRPDTPTERGTS